MIFRQPTIRYIWTLIPGMTALSIALESMYLGHKYPKSAQVILGFNSWSFLVACCFGIWSYRAWNQKVILDQNRLHIVAVSYTRHIELIEVESMDLFMNIFRNAWVIGARTKDGKIIKMPFWSRTFIRDDPRNGRLKNFLGLIDSAVHDARSGIQVHKIVVNY